MRAAAPHDAGVTGMSLRGPGARIRARIDRAEAVAKSSPEDALGLVDEFLRELQERRSDTDDPLDSDTRDDLAREALTLRTNLLLARTNVAEGFRLDFVRSVAEGASFSDWSLGVPASITLAQAILESDWGRSAPGNNLFGLKGVGPAGMTRRRVVEYHNGRRRVRTAAFRAYHDPIGSLLDHAKILAESRHYARARGAAEDPAAYAAALQGTYATDPRYASKLVALIDRYALDRFDWNPGSPWI
jgi:flagellum-specific peptidoglycan hydrolase FlgJ